MTPAHDHCTRPSPPFPPCCRLPGPILGHCGAPLGCRHACAQEREEKRETREEGKKSSRCRGDSRRWGPPRPQPWRGGGWRGGDVATHGSSKPRLAGRGPSPLPPRPTASSTTPPNDLEEGERGSALGWLQLADGGLLRTLFLSQLVVALLRSRPLLCPYARKRKEENKKEEDGVWAPHEPHHFVLLFSVTNKWAHCFFFFLDRIAT